MDNKQLWQAVLGELELLISKPSFTTWFKNTFIVSYENKEVVVGVTNVFTKNWLEKKYHSLILKALQNITQNQVKKVTYKIAAYKPETVPSPKSFAGTRTDDGLVKLVTAADRCGLNPKYTFENFIVGKENELAQAACLAVADKPGRAYNPLFIYGGVGLGKTHLLQAIGHRVLNNYPKKKILYVTSEQFTNDFIQAVRGGEARNFKNTYRLVDVLLIDDIQFISGKEGTQEEFFHTFNTLHQKNKQIVLSADRPPKAIPALEDRLLSRFEMGMVADILTPRLETKIAILEANCKKQNFKLNKEVINYIASTIKNNIRELEGALNKIIAYHQLHRLTPTIESTKKLLSSLSAYPARRSITPKQIINLVAKFYDINIDDLLGQSRKKNLALPRQITMYLMREEIKSSYPVIGQELGGRDHTTVMHAYLKISKLIKEDEKISQDIKLIKQKFYNSNFE